MRKCLVATYTSRRNNSKPPMKLNIATMNSVAMISDRWKSTKAPRNSATTTIDTSNAQIVHNEIARPSSRARRSSVRRLPLSSCMSLSWVLLSFCSSARARSTTRARRLVSSVSVTPTPESRNTGATAVRTTSPISWNWPSMPDANCPPLLLLRLTGAPFETVRGCGLAAAAQAAAGPGELLIEHQLAAVQFGALFDQQSFGASRCLAAVRLGRGLEIRTGFGPDQFAARERQ